MLKIDTDKTIRITRGDSGTITISAKNSSNEDYTFQVGDVVRIKVVEKNDMSKVKMTKDITIESSSTTASISITSTDSTIGELINKPTTYWYEVELNPDTTPNTIIGYDEDGPKEFILYPEGSNESE